MSVHDATPVIYQIEIGAVFHLVNLSEYELQPLFPQCSLVQQANSGLEYLQEESP